MDEKRQDKIAKSDAEWRAELTPEQYQVCRNKGTERAFTGAFWNTKTPGTYLCACCGQELFSSDTKFDSGTGWPSFWQPVDPGVVGTDTDRHCLHHPYGSALRPLWRAPGPPLRRRPGTHRPAILH